MLDMLLAAALLFCLLTVVAVGFQLALAMGAPWGAYAMGGRFPGRLPARMRGAAVVQAFVLALAALVVLARAGVMPGAFDAFAAPAIWFVVALYAVSAVMNTITPSRQERRLWSPIAFLLLACALYVAVA